uniref:Myelin expression factor 2 n=1 Tax=Eptatretus burgeri TaxID=7764 RepID=A0A8C4RA24_EPTBU
MIFLSKKKSENWRDDHRASRLRRGRFQPYSRGPRGSSAASGGAGGGGGGGGGGVRGSSDTSSDRRPGNRVFISNVPYEMRWQVIKDLMRDKVGEVTYVELFVDAEGKSMVSGVVEFKDSEHMSKAVEVMNKYDLHGRTLSLKEDPEGELARRALQKIGGGAIGGTAVHPVSGMDSGPQSMMSVPVGMRSNPNIPPELLAALQSGRLGTTIFISNLDYKVNWRKLKEVFSMAGQVKRADIKDKDGRSRGMGIITYEQPLHALQAISMFNGQPLYDRDMHVKMDDRSLPKDDFTLIEKPKQLPYGLGGVGLGFGPDGEPLKPEENDMASKGCIGPRGLGMDVPGFGGMSDRVGGLDPLPGFGMDRSNIGGYGGVGSSIGGIGGMGGSMGQMGGGMSGGLGPVDNFRRDIGNNIGTGLGNGMGVSMGDAFRPGYGSGFQREFNRDNMSRSFGNNMMGMLVGGGGMMGVGNLGPLSSNMTPMAGGLGAGMGAMGMNTTAMGLPNMDRMGGPALPPIPEMDRGGFGLGAGGFGVGLPPELGSGFPGCQIFVRNLPFDLTWPKLKESFSECGRVLFAEIKMENGRSKGCGTVRFDCPEGAERACRLMNGTRINGREIDVRLDRNA